MKTTRRPGERAGDTERTPAPASRTFGAAPRPVSSARPDPAASHTAPSTDSPLVSDPYCADSAVEPHCVGTTLARDWGDKASVGEQYAVAGRATGSRSGSAGKRPGSTIHTARTPQRSRAAGRSSHPRPASRRSRSTVRRIRRATRRPSSRGTRSPRDRRTSRRISSMPTTTRRRRSTIRARTRCKTSSEQFYEIFFNHRIAYVRKDEVDVVR
jgi:hypothetical protein